MDVDKVIAQYLLSTINPPLNFIQKNIHSQGKQVLAVSLQDFIFTCIRKKYVELPKDIIELIKNGKL